MLTQAPRGTKDVLPQDSYRWQAVEAKMREAAALAGYREVRTPVFEHTELFARGVGDTTDIVQKEMYTFKDKGDRSITLKERRVWRVRSWKAICMQRRCPARCIIWTRRFSAMKRRRTAVCASITSLVWNASVRRRRLRTRS